MSQLLAGKFDDEIRRGFLDFGLKVGEVVFDFFRGAISRERCKVEPRS